MTKTIVVPPGLGDFLWLAMKLINTNEKFNVVMSDGTPKRGHQLKELLPNLIASHEYRPKLSYKTINAQNIQLSKKKWGDIAQPEFYLSANLHLEQGKRIETFLPDLDTSYRIEYTTSDNDRKEAARLLPQGKSYIGVYTSAYSNSRHWNGWGVNEWYKLIRLLKHKDISFVFIGADYDIGTSQDLMELMEDRMDYVNTIGQPLSVVVEILKRLTYFIGFPSGLSILNETLQKDGTMFYSGPGIAPDGKQTPDHRLLMNAWPDPARIANNSYKGCTFPNPVEYFEWLKNTYHIFDKL